MKRADFECAALVEDLALSLWTGRVNHRRSAWNIEKFSVLRTPEHFLADFRFEAWLVRITQFGLWSCDCDVHRDGLLSTPVGDWGDHSDAPKLVRIQAGNVAGMTFFFVSCSESSHSVEFTTCALAPTDSVLFTLSGIITLSIRDGRSSPPSLVRRLHRLECRAHRIQQIPHEPRPVPFTRWL